jgi:hypothetical protein
MAVLPVRYYQIHLYCFNPMLGKDELFSSKFFLLPQLNNYYNSLFSDQCCLPTSSSGTPDWNTCRLYYELYPPSSCTGYQPPAIGKHK